VLELNEIYYGTKCTERTHRLSLALCKRAKESGEVVWLTEVSKAHTLTHTLKHSLTHTLTNTLTRTLTHTCPRSPPRATSRPSAPR